jgi:hypothetical protein
MQKVRNYVLGLPLIAVLAAGLVFTAVGTNLSAQTTQPPQQAHPRHGLFGTITSVVAGELTVTGRDGKPITVKVTSDTKIVERVSSHLTDVRAGDRVQVLAQKAQDGSLTAVAMLDSPADLATEGTRSGTRILRSGKVFVNGSVVSVSAASLSVAAGSGAATNVAVPPTARVQRLSALSATSLSAGMRVAVRGTTNPDGSFTASVITVAPTTKQ